MWVPTREEAVAIYARFCQSHYGVNAREKVTSRATQLGRQGDSDGERIWREVAQEIEKTKPESLPLSARATRKGFIVALHRNACATRASPRTAHLWITVSKFFRVRLRNSGNSCSEITESFS